MKNKSILIISFCMLSCGALSPLARGVEPEPPVRQAAPAKQDKISLDIKGMDVVDVLKMISNRSGMNIVLGKNVTGKVTLFLKDVDIHDAFEIILLSNDLAYTKEGDIINVMTQRDYELAFGERFKDKKELKIIHLQYAKAADLARSLNQMKTNVGRIVADEGSNTLVLMDSLEILKKMEDFISKADLPLETRVFPLNYAAADKLSEKLLETVTKGVGSIKKDERTNKIIVTDYPAKLDEIANIIKAFDEKTPQVLIDAQIIEITPSDKFEMGVNWDYWIKKYLDIRAPLPVNQTTALFIGTSPSPTTPGQPGKYKAVIDILRTIGDTKVLSSPRIMALNNQEAKILVGTKDAYITSTQSQGASGQVLTSQSVNFVDVGLKLYVTPTINRDGFVTMKIRPEVSSSTRTDITSEGQVSQIPIVTTSEAETTVMVRDGITIVIGGLKKDKREKTVKKIPIAADLPLIGHLFRSTSDNVTKTELVILLTPHIMTGETPFTDFASVKPKEGAVARMEKGQIVTDNYSSAKETEILNAFNKEPLSPDYAQSIIEKIKNFAKSNAPKGKTGEVTLSFELSRKGKLLEEPRIIVATDDVLVEPAIKAIKGASPFGPFPKEMTRQEETFKITLTYE